MRSYGPRGARHARDVIIRRMLTYPFRLTTAAPSRSVRLRPRTRSGQRAVPGSGTGMAAFLRYSASCLGGVTGVRVACLQQVLPLEERQGWDEFARSKPSYPVAAPPRSTICRSTITDQRASGMLRAPAVGPQGDTAHYMGYRFSYLLLRALWRATSDAAALGMVYGYLSAALRRDPAVQMRR